MIPQRLTKIAAGKGSKENQNLDLKFLFSVHPVDIKCDCFASKISACLQRSVQDSQVLRDKNATRQLREILSCEISGTRRYFVVLVFAAVISIFWGG